MKPVSAAGPVAVALLLMCSVARADFILDVNGVQVADDPTNTALDVSGSANGLNYTLRALGPKQGFVSSLSGFFFFATHTAPFPITISLTQTDLSLALGPNTLGATMLAECSGFCSASDVPIPFGSSNVWFDSDNGGERATLLFSQQLVLSGNLLILPNVPVGITGPFSMTQEVNFNPTIFTTAPAAGVPFATRVFVPTVPEPSVLSLLVVGGLVAIVFMSRRFRNSPQFSV